MAEQRIPRELETRDKQATKKQWMPADRLPEPHQVEGYGHRWVRTATMGVADPTNVSKSLREGWEPCKLSEYPELMMSIDPGSQGSDQIRVGGLMLCRMPNEMIAQRNAYYGNANSAQVQSVDASFMKENDPRMPLFAEKKSSTSFGRGTR